LAAALEFGRSVAAGDTDRNVVWLMANVRSMVSAPLAAFVEPISWSDEQGSTPPVVSLWPDLVHVPLEPELQLLADRNDPIRAHRARTGSMAALRLCDVVDDVPAFRAQPHERAIAEHELLHYGVSLSYVLTMRVPLPGSRLAALNLLCDREFSDRDVQLFESIRPFVGVFVLDLARNEHGRRVDDDAGLTCREREILDHVALGATNRQIAVSLGISKDTVRTHLEHAFAKLEVSTRTAALARTGRVRPDAPR
jgi:DNA-binding CsgD family transcriptional regulator